MFSNLFKHRFLFSLINVYLHDILHPVYYLCSNDQKFENVILNLSFHTLFSSKFICIMAFSGSSLVAQWSRIHLHCRSCSNQGSVPESRRSPGGGHGNRFQYSCLENPMDRGVWWATVHRVTQSWTWSNLACGLFFSFRDHSLWGRPTVMSWRNSRSPV